MMPPPQHVIAETRAWLVRSVIGLNLCPFAKAVHARNQVRYVVSSATNSDTLRAELCAEMHLLVAADPALVDTTMLIHPEVLQGFLDFNDFLDVADDALKTEGLEGVLQVASFHPLFQFAGTRPDEVANATNRSPYPTLHLLREQSVDRAVAAGPTAEAICEANQCTLHALGAEGWAALQAQCKADAEQQEGPGRSALKDKGPAAQRATGPEWS